MNVYVKIFLLVCSVCTISLSRHEQVCLGGLLFERCFSHHRMKYLSKRSPLKHACSWRDKLIVQWMFICWYQQKRKFLLIFNTSLFWIRSYILWIFVYLIGEKKSEKSDSVYHKWLYSPKKNYPDFIMIFFML